MDQVDQTDPDIKHKQDEEVVLSYWKLYYFSDWSFSAPHLLLDPVAPGFLVALGPLFLRCLPVVLSDRLIHHDPAEWLELRLKTQ